MERSTVLIVPGLRDHVALHWQTLLAAQRPGCVSVPPMGRENLDCQARIDAVEAAVSAIAGPVVLVAHSGGCITVAHWAALSSLSWRVRGALLATPPDFDTPMPEGYPPTAALQAAGWFPVPRARLPFPSLVALSHNDPLGRIDHVRALARDWGSATIDLGEVGHLNPASGFGPWPQAQALIEDLDR
ncbi:RBBP9/YdeN family alpha/beta hydrolase [Hydrogenophaga sp. MI9]|uniref:RBBP9/YdeN family alpha/beta hydrolase n=1 Tax=Hydrogenophaga sp. MI9 TaxID=3453719 RepID=UPI003EEAC383